MFQFLSRNSVRWDQVYTRIYNKAAESVSIPQSEFCPLGRRPNPQSIPIVRLFQFLSRNSVRWDLLAIDDYADEYGVSIPQSEFCPLGQNTSNGIMATARKFQFLSRNSVRWDPAREERRRQRSHCVSIPQSEFCPLGPLADALEGALDRIVSIPQSEFCPLGLAISSAICRDAPESWFQFLSRNSVRWDAGACMR